MCKIGVIGDYESIFCFAAAGFDIFPAKDLAAAHNAFAEISHSEYTIVFITEQYLAETGNIIAEYEENAALTIVAVPTFEKKLMLAQRMIQSYAQRAVGAEII